MPRSPVLTLALAATILVGAVLALMLTPLLRDSRELEERLAVATADLQNGRWVEARGSLAALSEQARDTRGRLDGTLGSIAKRIPVVGRSFKTSRAVVESGSAAANAALEVLPVLEERTFFSKGAINLEALRPLRAAAQTQRPRLAQALKVVEASDAAPIVPRVARARTRAIDQLSSAVEAIDVAVAAIDLSDAVLGAEGGARRYFIVFENPSELVGTGGLWGNYGVLAANDAKIELGRFGRISTLQKYATNEGPDWYRARYRRYGLHEWNRLGTAPDFPTVAGVAEANVNDAPDIGPVDGTIAIDPIGLASLLRATGPVSVPDWPEPISADNIVPVTLHDAYSHFSTNEERIEFLGTTARAVWSNFLKADLGIRQLAASGLGDAIRNKHLRFHFTRPDEQQLAEALGAAGDLGDPGRTMGVVTQNVAGNKMDYWLKRDIEIDLELQANGSATGQATIELTNGGPASGEPRYVIGPYSDEYRQGWNYQFVRMYLPAGSVLRHASREESDDLAAATELGFTVVEWEESIAPSKTASRTITFHIDDFWDTGDDSFSMVLRKQASMDHETVELTVQPPWGQRLDVSDEGPCGKPQAAGDIEIGGAVKRSVIGWILGPWARDVTCERRSA